MLAEHIGVGIFMDEIGEWVLQVASMGSNQCYVKKLFNGTGVWRRLVPHQWQELCGGAYIVALASPVGPNKPPMIVVRPRPFQKKLIF